MTGQVLLFLFHVSNGNLILSIGRPRLSGKDGEWPGPKFDPKNSSKLKIKFQIVIGRRRGSLLPPQVFCGVCVVQSLVFCIVFCRLFFVLLPLLFLAIALSVLLFTTSDYSFI
jgi:hypothetical protein